MSIFPIKKSKKLCCKMKYGDNPTFCSRGIISNFLWKGKKLQQRFRKMTGDKNEQNMKMNATISPIMSLYTQRKSNEYPLEKKVERFLKIDMANFRNNPNKSRSVQTVPSRQHYLQFYAFSTRLIRNLISVWI